MAGKQGKKSKQAKPKSFEYEFGGPFGTAALTVGLPIFILFTYFICNGDGCLSLTSFRFPEGLDAMWKPWERFDRSGAFVFAMWLAVQALLYITLPGKWVQGVPVKGSKDRLFYKLNGLLAFGVSLIGAAGLHLCGVLDLARLYDLFLSMAISAIVFSYSFSFLLYVSSFVGSKVLADPGNSGNPMYDYWMGRELNPRIKTFDIKVFLELRPGLIGWCLLDMGMAAKQAQLHGAVSNSMVLVLLFQVLYVLDSFLSEAALLTTKDVTDEGLGFMLVFGDLVWVPFLYTIQARYLVDYPVHMSWPMVFFVLALNLLGLTIFRCSNSQKNAFRRNPNDPALKHLKYISTNRGTRLLISGWWGVARHINYLGDILMGLAWCLPCGFEHIVPYFYFFYFVIMLVHRDRRDCELCAHKYGKDWDRYCALVPWRILPYVY